jgi:hypothetical protein
MGHTWLPTQTTSGGLALANTIPSSDVKRVVKATAAIAMDALKRLDLIIFFRSYPEPDMLTLVAPLSWEVGDGFLI